jgi:hypothetical protein
MFHDRELAVRFGVDWDAAVRVVDPDNSPSVEGVPRAICSDPRGSTGNALECWVHRATRCGADTHAKRREVDDPWKLVGDGGYTKCYADSYVKNGLEEIRKRIHEAILLSHKWLPWGGHTLKHQQLRYWGMSPSFLSLRSIDTFHPNKLDRGACTRFSYVVLFCERDTTQPFIWFCVCQWLLIILIWFLSLRII